MDFKKAYDICMPEAKRKKEKYNIWVAYCVRPLSVLCTIPFVSTKIKPSTVTFWSIIASLIGFLLIAADYGLCCRVIGWLFFFIWAILDGVDGNLARCQGTSSSLGELWDATGGYAAMILIYFSAGIAAFYDSNLYDFCNKELLLIFGGATALFSIFPRLIMHKKKSSGVSDSSISKLQDKTSFNLFQIIAMNFISVSGFMQVIFLLCIVCHTLNFFIFIYMLINGIIMLKSLNSLLK